MEPPCITEFLLMTAEALRKKTTFDARQQAAEFYTQSLTPALENTAREGKKRYCLQRSSVYFDSTELMALLRELGFGVALVLDPRDGDFIEITW